ncbi:MAG TPA: monovalent cation/H+ antiporter complex subunit F [Acidimicrobiales bacterium]|nr:monovalent cation/H+ antiporter complex subunit F [Acidimicrobiales bacterium]
MTTVLTISAAIMVAAAALATAAALRRDRNLPDRAIALDVLVSLIIGGLAIGAAASSDGRFADLALILCVLGFIATATVARYLGDHQQ